MTTLSKSPTSTRTASSFRKVTTLFSLTLITVSRIEARSEVNKLEIELDINTDIYPMEKDAYYAMAIASSVNIDGSEDFDFLRFQNEGAKEGHGSLLD